jgi:hypothetical protein
MVDRLRALVPRLRANSAVQGHPSIRSGAHVRLFVFPNSLGALAYYTCRFLPRRGPSIRAVQSLCAGLFIGVHASIQITTAYSLRIRTYFYLLSLLVRGSLLPKHDRAAACLLFSRQLVGVPNLQGYINWLNSV